jgi:hypothetical protein
MKTSDLQEIAIIKLKAIFIIEILLIHEKDILEDCLQINNL